MEEEKNVTTSIEETEEVQTVLDIDDEFLKASLEDENVEVNLNVETDVEGIGAIEDEGIGSTYTPRLTAPSISDKNWLHYTKGGYNYCILISGNSCLPNCVGYAWGRWRELLGAYHKLSRANAENWWGNTGDGYQRGQTPRVGAVICWRKGQAGNAADGAGHVAIVERVNADGSITTSNSGYGGSRFWTATYKYPYNVGKNYFFQGFIYNPAIKEDAPTKPITPTQDNTNGYTGKFKVGDKVVINGSLFVSSKALNASSKVNNKVTTITRVAANTAHPYNTTGDLGWMNESDIKLYQEPAPTPKPTPTPNNELKAGDKVKIIGTGNGSADGDKRTAGGIGWTRTILKVYSGKPFPYRVGNSSGTTGFYKAEALKKL